MCDKVEKVLLRVSDAHATYVKRSLTILNENIFTCLSGLGISMM